MKKHARDLKRGDVMHFEGELIVIERVRDKGDYVEIVYSFAAEPARWVTDSMHITGDEWEVLDKTTRHLRFDGEVPKVGGVVTMIDGETDESVLCRVEVLL